MEEYLELSPEEKKQSVRAKIKNIQYAKFNIEISLRTESAVSEPNQFEIQSLNNQLTELQEKEAELLVILGELG
jgi:hypothetical protein